MPKLRPNYFRLLGVRFSDKSFKYALGLQLALSDGTRTLLPTLAGAVFGLIYISDALRLQALTWPRPLRGLCRRTLGAVLDSDPPAPASAAAGAGARRGGRGGGAGYGRDEDDAAAAIAAVAAMRGRQGGAGAAEALPQGPPPDPAAIERLCGLGFERAQVERALREAFGDENAAANRLLGG